VIKKFHKIPLFVICLLALGLNSCKEKKKHSLSVIKIDYYADHLGLGDYNDCEMKFFDENGKVIFDLTPQLKYRGNSSFQYAKKSFTLKLDEPKSFAGMDKNIYWKLNADYIDKTFMRNKISYELFRSFSEGNYAPKVDYVVLYENENYKGIYSIVEGVDEYRLGLDLKDPKAVLFKEPPLHFPPNEHAKRYKNFAHYSEVDVRYANYSQKAKKKLIKRSYYNQRYPDISDSNKKNDIHKLTEFIHNSSDEDFKNKIFTEYFSIENIIDWHLLLLITNNGDGIKKNNYIFKRDSSSPYLYCPWDFDHSFGREGDGEPITEDICDVESHKLFERLVELNPDGYIEKLPKKFMKLYESGILSVENIHAMIDKNAEKLRPEIKANEALWPLNEVGYFKGSDFEKEVQLMKDWIEKRIQKLRVSFAETVGSFNCFGPAIEPVPLAPQMVIHKPIGSAIQVPDY
tara:strand:+ start:2094 stop:3470 length:1377 start_codon:yes stop_codon:yes gene_type:complete